MAIPFLNNITLNNNEIQNVKLQNAGSPPLNSGPGQIYFDTSADINFGGTARYYANALEGWVSLKEYSFANGTYINSTVTGTVAKPIITLDLSATAVSGSIDNTKYLRGDNKWASIGTIPGTYTWGIQADTGGPVAIASGNTIDFAGGANVTTVFSGSTLTINSTDNYVDSLAFDTATGVLSVGRTGPYADITQSLDGRYLTGNQTVTLSGDVTGSGTTSIVTTIAAGAVDFAMLNPVDVITEAEGIENNDNDITIPTSAAVKAYADSLIVGGLIYQGGYNAATNTPDLTITPNSILKGWTYTVTVEGTFYGEQLRVGDVLISEVNNPADLPDWTTVQNNIDLASLTQIGIGNVNAGTGISVAYSAGTATVTNADTNASNTFSGLIGNGTLTSLQIPSATHLLGTDSSSFMIQLVEVSSGETVYADVTRGASGLVTIDFAVAPATNSIRVLIQKIG